MTSSSSSELRDEAPTHQYTDKLPSDISIARRVLETYSGISPDEVIPHILAIHAKAITHPDPYPCITSFRYLQFHISTHPLYTHILSRLTCPKSTQCLLDLGTCFGQDLRMFASDGAPPQNLYGADLHPKFIALGFELFLDRDRFEDNFVVGDIFSETSDLQKFAGKMDMISATAFLHLFGWEDQVRVCEQMVLFLKPVERGEEKQVLFGRQSGSVNPGVRVREVVKWGRQEVFMHDVDSFRKLWEEVGRKTGTKWEVRGELRALGSEGVKEIEDAETARLLLFSVWRLDEGVASESESVEEELEGIRGEKEEGELEVERLERELIEDGAV